MSKASSVPCHDTDARIPERRFETVIIKDPITRSRAISSLYAPLLAISAPDEPSLGGSIVSITRHYSIRTDIISDGETSHARTRVIIVTAIYRLRDSVCDSRRRIKLQHSRARIFQNRRM